MAQCIAWISIEVLKETASYFTELVKSLDSPYHLLLYYLYGW